MPKTPHRRTPRLDDRTKAVGGPPLKVRNDALDERTPGENPNAEVETHFISIERSPGRLTPFSTRLLTQDIIEAIGRKRPDMIYVYLHTAVNVVGPRTRDRDGAPAPVTASNADQWRPTNGWEPRTMFWQPAVALAPRQNPVDVAVQQVDAALGDAEAQHDDNKFIYIVGATVALVTVKE
jgi:hypothetical protein